MWIAWVASVSVGFGSNERPRNGNFCILPARKIGRSIYRPVVLGSRTAQKRLLSRLNGDNFRIFMLCYFILVILFFFLLFFRDVVSTWSSGTGRIYVLTPAGHSEYFQLRLHTLLFEREIKYKFNF